MLFYLQAIVILIGSRYCVGAPPYSQYIDLQERVLAADLRSEDIDTVKYIFTTERDVEKGILLIKSVIEQKQSKKQQLLPCSNGYIKTSRKLYKHLVEAEINTDILQDYILQTWNFCINYEIDNVKCKSKFLGWVLSDILLCLLELYEINGEPENLKLVVEYFSFVRSHLDSKSDKIDETRDNPLDGWGFDRPPDSLWETEVTITGRVLLPLSKFALLVRGDETLQELYGSDAAEMVDFADKIARPFAMEYESDQLGGTYFVNIRLQKHEPINHQAAFIQTCSYLSLLTNEILYAKVVRGFLQYFKNNAWLEEENALVWFYKVEGKKSIPSMTWKAGVTTACLVDLHKNGFKIDRQTRTSVVNTLLVNVTGKFATTDGNISSRKHHPITGYNIVNGSRINPGVHRWIYLSEWNKEATKRVVSIVATRPDVHPFGWFINPSSVNSYIYYQKQLFNKRLSQEHTDIDS
jgi:hypothetical protein